MPSKEEVEAMAKRLEESAYLLQSLRLFNLARGCEEAAALLRSLQEGRERLREALKPFADAAAAYDPFEGDDRAIAWEHDFDIGQLRRARAACGPETQKEPPTP